MGRGVLPFSRSCAPASQRSCAFCERARRRESLPSGLQGEQTHLNAGRLATYNPLAPAPDTNFFLTGDGLLAGCWTRGCDVSLQSSLNEVGSDIMLRLQCSDITSLSSAHSYSLHLACVCLHDEYVQNTELLSRQQIVRCQEANKGRINSKQALMNM